MTAASRGRGSVGRCLASLFSGFSVLSGVRVLVARVSRWVTYVLSVRRSLSSVRLSSVLRSSMTRLEGRGFPEADLLCDVDWNC